MHVDVFVRVNRMSVNIVIYLYKYKGIIKVGRNIVRVNRVGINIEMCMQNNCKG